MQNILTYYRLGLRNILRIIIYRLLCKSGFYQKTLPIGQVYKGRFWEWPETFNGLQDAPNNDWTSQADRILNGEQFFYSYDWRQVGFPPKTSESTKIHWTKIQEFSLDDDVKNIWEPSRFHGLLTIALAYLVSGDKRYSKAIEAWLESWVNENPTNQGVQWKCGQETGIRLIHTLLVAELLKEHSGVLPTENLKKFVNQHCQRIAPTMLYAVAQDNNHGTSEATALYMAGLWLKNYFPYENNSKKWTSLGVKWLENRVDNLIMNDGSFSQHSINYHRLMLDTITFAEYWRMKFNDKLFSTKWYEKAVKATQWLATLVDPETGNAPNLGANDGARICILHNAKYRDYRPTIHLAATCFKIDTLPFDQSFNEIYYWLKLKSQPLKKVRKRNILLADGGYVYLTKGPVWGVLKLPAFKFRPSHSDAFHFDLWKNGINWLRDGGTFSYNADKKWLHYFPGTASHSTIQFDNRDQMPRLSRFLFGKWLTYKKLIFSPEDPTSVTATYIDYQNAQHTRTIVMNDNGCVIKDEVSNFEKKATLRLRLLPVKWELNNFSLISNECHIKIECSNVVNRCELLIGHDSLHYEQLTEVPVLECDVTSSPTTFITTITFQDLK